MVASTSDLIIDCNNKKMLLYKGLLLKIYQLY